MNAVLCPASCVLRAMDVGRVGARYARPGRYVLVVLVPILIGLVHGCATTPKAPASRFEGEPAPTFRAFELLPVAALRGSNYRIAQRVTVTDYYYVFTIESDFGTIVATSRDMLELRLRELKAIEAAEVLSRDPHVVAGVVAPMRATVKGFELILTEPLASLERAPRGFGRMVRQYVNSADRRAGSAARRKLAAELDCDPETSNPVLKKLLDEMALEQGAGGLLTRAAISFVPGLGVLATTADIKDMIVNRPPSAINHELDQELQAAGVEKYVRKRFVKSAAFTTMQRLRLMLCFRKLDGAQNRSALIESAAEARTEAEALGVMREAEMLERIHDQEPIERLQFVGLPLAILRDGTHFIVCPSDYVTNTLEVQQAVASYRQACPDESIVLAVAGRVSALTRATLDTAGLSLKEERASN